ncbi:MAG TPA: hypothetical protein VKJ45_17670 [Blastocatellia bacterium]|nr:hypothetical protein [Blastocatellia bacterium]
MHQAANLEALLGPSPGITFKTTPPDYQAIKKLREMRFNGDIWQLLDDWLS